MRPWRTQAYENARDRSRNLSAGFDIDSVSDTDPDYLSVFSHIPGSLLDAVARTQALSRNKGNTGLVFRGSMGLCSTCSVAGQLATFVERQEWHESPATRCVDR